jgi:C4-dicarboxylate-specific signal transduction histidine kinase
MLKLEEGERKWVSMNDVLREAVTLFHSESIIRNVRVEKHVTEPLPPVMVDKVLILQVLINLLMNAAESIGLGVSGDREITLTTWATDDDTVRVAVRHRAGHRSGGAQ